ncbi:MAG: ThuA domain-containing protein [Planctomycetes bacterium]|nr:ThuA domain-containing protein [Planctomycetota bacterium]
MLRTFLAVLSVVAASVSVSAEEPAARPAPKRVLVYTVSAGYEHDVVKRAKPDEPSLVERTLVELGKQRGWFECVLSRDAKDFTKENLATFDLVFFYTTGELPFTDDAKRALLDFVKDGKAFAGAHCATDTFYKLPEYGEMVGGYFDGHPWHEKVVLRVEDKEHASTRHLGASWELVDEIYQFKAPYGRSKLHVLLSLDPAKNDLAKQGVNRKDGDFANAWCKDVGKGRLFYTALGHRPEVWADERFLKHVEGGFAWAMRAEERAGFAAKKDVPAKAKEDAPKQDALAKPKEVAAKKGEPEPPKADAAKKDELQRAEPAKGKPKVPDGFAIDLVMEAPEILWPSAVVCLDDGTLLVGEDRMDMPGPTDQPIDRLIALHFQPDGSVKKTVFAERLFAVMGLEVVDGDVYVMNMPHLTQLTDADGDGVAEKRVEVLTDLGPNAPGWPGGFNDHIVSGIRLGMDGFLYVAVGDKGIPKAHGTDGSELTLRGGGVIRVRPDGSRLEVVASGLRNILDVAIDAQGELFTYDNTDDGLGWWTRLTHVVPGGYYGYPWDYKDHPERMLPCMADYGGGSPCGGLVYREAAWPEEFRGNLIYCEWGKSMLRRFVLEPKGATFGVKLAEDFVTAGDVRPFKPFDVCESPDGRFLYVSDWAYEGWTAKAEAGRVWRLRRADDDPRVASTLRPIAATPKELGKELDDPSYRVRARAQRKLATLGGAGLDVSKPIAAASRGGLGQLHAIWSVAEAWHREEPWRIDAQSQPHSIPSWVQLCRAELAFPERVRVEYLWLMMEPHVVRTPEVVRAAAARVRRERAAGADPEKSIKILGGLALTSALDAWGRYRALRALRAAGVLPTYGPAVQEHEAEFLSSLRGACDVAVVDELGRRLGASDESGDRALVLSTLASCARMEAPWDGKWWNIQPAKTPRPARTVDWSGTRRVLDVVRGALRDGDAAVRRAALDAVRELDVRDALATVRSMAESERDPATRLLALDVLGAMKDEGASGVLERVVRDASLSHDERQHAVEAACAIRSKPMLALLRSIACDASAQTAQSVACIEALARLKDTESVSGLAQRAGSGDEGVRIAALAALAKIQGKDAGPVLAAQLADASKAVRIAACKALAEAGDARQVPALLPLTSDASTSAEATLALARTPDVKALGAFLAGVASSEKRVVDASQNALLALRDPARAELEALHKAGKLDEKQLAAVQLAYSTPQPVVDWRVLGPFDRVGAKPIVLERARETSKGVTIDAERPDLAARYTGREKAEFGWRDARADPKTSFLDLRAFYDGFDEVSAFAFARVGSNTKRKAKLLVGSDDMVRVWLNGALIHEHDVYRAWREDEDELDVELQPGENALLVRVDNGGGGWSFDVKVSSEGTGPLFERKALAPGLEEYRAYALEHAGDARRGYDVFRQQSGPMCIRCHAVFGEGGKVGPDLSDVAAKYGPEELLTSVLTPSQRIAEGYNAVAIELTNGSMVFGQIQKETADTLEFYDTNGELKKLDTSDVESRTPSKTSVMPDGLAPLMSKDAFADLFAYLRTLRGAPK